MTTPNATIYQKLDTLGITLPPVAAPAAAYVPYAQTGKLIFLSGHLAKKTARWWSANWAKTSRLEKARRLHA